MPGFSVGEVINPVSIAVVGASDNSGSSGRRFFSALVEYGFQGELYPINPGRDEAAKGGPPVSSYGGIPGLGPVSHHRADSILPGIPEHPG